MFTSQQHLIRCILFLWHQREWTMFSGIFGSCYNAIRNTIMSKCFSCALFCCQFFLSEVLKIHEANWDEQSCDVCRTCYEHWSPTWHSRFIARAPNCLQTWIQASGKYKKMNNLADKKAWQLTRWKKNNAKPLLCATQSFVLDSEVVQYHIQLQHKEAMGGGLPRRTRILHI